MLVYTADQFQPQASLATLFQTPKNERSGREGDGSTTDASAEPVSPPRASPAPVRAERALFDTKIRIVDPSFFRGERSSCGGGLKNSSGNRIRKEKLCLFFVVPV